MTNTLKTMITVTLQNGISDLGPLPDKYGEKVKEIVTGESITQIMTLGAHIEDCIKSKSWDLLENCSLFTKSEGDSTKDKNELFYENKKRIEQAWDLLEISRELIYDVVDETSTNLGESYELYKMLVEIDERLYKLYDLNIETLKDK